jgi:hypothetical protein
MERAKNQWITSWLERHPDRDEDAARSEWDALSIELRCHLMNISEMEIRIIEEIRVKLLNFLDEYPAPETLKEPFRIRCQHL